MREKNKKNLELVLHLAKTDFKLRYQGSILGYVWALLKPLLLFAVLNFVFSSVFNFKNIGIPYYSLELLTGILLFSFFSEGTIAGIQSLISKGQLISKIAISKWTIVVSSTLNAFFVFCMNLFVLALFFLMYGKIPSLLAVVLFVVYVFLLYMSILAVSFFLAPLLVRFRDVGMIWEVLLPVLMYAAPIIYPLSLIPAEYHQIMLANPIAFIIHFSKQGLILDHFATFGQIVIFIIVLAAAVFGSILFFNKQEARIAEYM